MQSISKMHNLTQMGQKRIIFTLMIHALIYTVEAQWIEDESHLTTSLNVGVGTNTPNSALEVKKSGVQMSQTQNVAHFTFGGWNHYSNSNGDQTEGKLVFSSQSFSNPLLNRAELSFSTSGSWQSGGALHFYTAPDDASWIPIKRLTIDHKGRVGVGTDEPTETLSVKGTASISDKLLANATWIGGDPNLQVGSNFYSKGFIGFHDEEHGSADFIGYKDNVFFLKNAGYDEWWSSTQVEEPALAFSGGLFLSSALFNYAGGTELDEQYVDTDQFISFFDSKGNWGADMIAYKDNTFTFAPIAIENENIESSNPNVHVLGKVAIGTRDFSGTHKLRVEGSIGAREIKVQAEGWSDFVFEEHYDLRTIEQIEKYIEKKGHLPEIPSEDDVKENGINLAEMDAKLLMKVEELTLYLIQMNKEIGRLKSKNETLESELKKVMSKLEK